MSQRDRIAAYVDAIGPGAGDVLRMPFGDRDALDLAVEMAAVHMPFLRQAGMDEAIPVMQVAMSVAPPADVSDTVALIAYAESMRFAVAKFWDSFEGQTCDGVTIIRRRA